jgi:hypothetical protein
MPDKLPEIKDYPRRDEPPLEDLPWDQDEEDREMEGRSPDLGELEEDDAEL